MINLNDILDFEDNIQNSKVEPEAGFLFIQGNNKVLITAPHSVTQTRNGKLKIAETRTAPITKLLASKTNAYALIKTINKDDDANFDPENYFKDKALEIIKREGIVLVIDLHIMSNHRGYNIDVGTGEGANAQIKIVNTIKHCLGEKLSGVYVDHVFKSLYEHTVSSAMHKKANIDCVQIEINFEIIEDIDGITYIINALSNAIQTILT